MSSKRTNEMKTSVYDSEPRLANLTSATNRCYSSMNDIQMNRSMPNVHVNRRAHRLPSIDDYECDISYEVDSPRHNDESSSSSSSSTSSTTTALGYLNAFLKRKQQEQKQMSIRSSHPVKQLIEQFDQTNVSPRFLRPLSAPLVDRSSKPTKGILQRRVNSNIIPAQCKLTRKRSKSVTFECYTDDDDARPTISTINDDSIQQRVDHTTSPRINIGITLDSRLRRTPALDMLRSTTMQSDVLVESNATDCQRQIIVPMARF
jgi:hypothetical protein